MTEMRQGHLFPLPRTIEFKLTPRQREVLDWVAFNEGSNRAVSIPAVARHATAHGGQGAGQVRRLFACALRPDRAGACRAVIESWWGRA
jgi:hypothetical protein